MSIKGFIFTGQTQVGQIRRSIHKTIKNTNFKQRIIMRKNKLLVLSILLSLFTGCYQDDFNSFSKETSPDVNLVTPETALLAANYFLNSNDVLAQTRSNPIKESFSIKNSKEQPIVYVINYENGGFVIIAGDKRIEPLLAYSDKGYFSSNSSLYPGGLEIWLESINNRVNYARENNETPDYLVEALWKDISEVFTTRSLPVYENEGCLPLSNVTIGPLLSTHWHQDSPFNNYLPLLGNGNHAYVGCVPVAIAQVMSFFQFPTTYSWNSMPNYSANSYVWELISDIHTLLGSNITYSETGTFVSHNYDKGNFLKQKMYYTNAIQANYNYNTVKNEILSYQRPVILSGKSNSNVGHTWVCDGAHKWETCTELDDGTFYLYGYLTFHCNWGNGANLDGWFSFNNFVMNGTELNNSLKMVYNIIP